MFEMFEGMLLELGPQPGFTLLGEQVEGDYDVGEVRDEFSVKIHKSSEQPDSLDGGGRFPFLYGI